MNLCVIRAGQDGWIGLSSCTFDRSRMPHASCTSFTRSTASEPVTLASSSSSTTNLGGLTGRRRRRPTGGDRRVSVGLTSNVVWTGSEEANDTYYMMDGTGSEVKGQA